MEVVLLPLLLARPFRCESCGNRFYGLALPKRVSVLRDAKAIPDLVQDLPVLVYGRGDDEADHAGLDGSEAFDIAARLDGGTLRL